MLSAEAKAIADAVYGVLRGREIGAVMVGIANGYARVLADLGLDDAASVKHHASGLDLNLRLVCARLHADEEGE
jgi:hypothetical protein